MNKLMLDARGVQVDLSPSGGDDLHLHGSVADVEVFDRYPVSDRAKDEVADAMEEGPVEEGLARLLEYDKDTHDHVIGVGLLATHLALKDGLEYGARRRLARGALLHDLGKVGVDIDIINPRHRAAEKLDKSAGDLTFREIQRHPILGYVMVKGLYEADESEHAPDIDPSAPQVIGNLVLTHHCHNEARAPYPSLGDLGHLHEQGQLDMATIQDPELQQLGRYLGLADTYEAITANRSYNNDGRFRDPLNVLDVLETSHGSMDAQTEELMMGIHLQRFPFGWMPDTAVDLRQAVRV